MNLSLKKDEEGRVENILERNPTKCFVELAVAHCRPVENMIHRIRLEQSGVEQIYVSD